MNLTSDSEAILNDTIALLVGQMEQYNTGGVCLNLDVQGQGDGRILDVDGQGGWGVLKIGQFS